MYLTGLVAGGGTGLPSRGSAPQVASVLYDLPVLLVALDAMLNIAFVKLC